MFRCDADPRALAKYIVALIKKDKPEDELKSVCEDQLEVFLQKGILFCTNSLTDIAYSVPESYLALQFSYRN